MYYKAILPGMALIPFILLAVLNFKLYRKIKVKVHSDLMHAVDSLVDILDIAKRSNSIH